MKWAVKYYSRRDAEGIWVDRAGYCVYGAHEHVEKYAGIYDDINKGYQMINTWNLKALLAGGTGAHYLVEEYP